MVGFAKWNYPHHLNEEQLAQWQFKSGRQGPYPEGTNRPLLDDVNKQIWASRTKWINHEKTFCECLKTVQGFLPSVLEF